MKYYNNIEGCLEFNQDELGSRLEITEERAKELIAGMSQGMSLVAGLDGYPILQDISQAEKDKRQSFSEIERLKAELTATDYKAIKFAEGQISAVDYEPTKIERQELRNKINILQLLIK